MSIKTATTKETIIHTAIWATTAGALAGWIEWLYSDEVHQILIAGAAQFWLSSINWSVSLVIYDRVKAKVYDILSNPILAKASGGILSWLEVACFTYIVQKVWKVDSAALIAGSFGLWIAIWLPTVYEKFILKNKKYGNSFCKFVSDYSISIKIKSFIEISKH